RENHLVGIVSMRDLLIAGRDVTLGSIMKTDILAVNAFMDREEVANELSRSKYFAAPVVDQESRLLGLVKTDQLLESVQEEAGEDLLKLFGAGGDERSFS